LLHFSRKKARFFIKNTLKSLFCLVIAPVFVVFSRSAGIQTRLFDKHSYPKPLKMPRLEVVSSTRFRDFISKNNTTNRQHQTNTTNIHNAFGRRNTSGKNGTP